MINVKKGVEFTVIAPAGYCILAALKLASKTLGVDLTITSACDGEHSGPNDPHHTGNAYDVRSHDIDPAIRVRVVGVVMAILGWDHFYGVLEDIATSTEHFHFQRKRETAFDVQQWLNA